MVECAQCRFLQGAVFAAVIGYVGAFVSLSPIFNLHHSCAFQLLAVQPLCLLLEN